MSSIEWTGQTWNPIIGCTEITPGCRECYAAKMSYRLMHIPAMAEDYAGIAKRLPGGKIVFTGLVKEMPDRLIEPFKRKKPTTYFVNSMSDLFHKDVSFNFIYKVFEMMMHCPHHTFQILTKRADIMHDMVKEVYFHMSRNYPEVTVPLPNVHLGVSVEDQPRADKRIPYLVRTAAAIRFISYEPALGPVNFMHQLLNFGDSGWLLKKEKLQQMINDYGKFGMKEPKQSIDWIICGGESGHNARPIHPDWARSVRDQCESAGIAFFFKQWGQWFPFYDRDIDDPDWRNVPDESKNVCRFNLAGEQGFHGERVIYFNKVGKAAAGCLLDGKEHKELPKSIK